MKKIEESERIEKIEKAWNDSIKDLFYNWHWKNNLTHKEIGNKISTPRSTVTRWFKQFKISSQTCQRMTKRRWQIRLVKVLKQVKRQKFRTDPPCLANKHFFKTWSPEMAYVLGYFAADGCMFINPRGSRYIEFTSIDKELIKNVKLAMDSKHSIGTRRKNHSKWKTQYRLQIGSKEMFKDLLILGFTPHKSKIIEFPIVPKSFLSDFVRGYFDGDGCVYHGLHNRKNRPNKQFILSTHFVSGSKGFLHTLHECLIKKAGIEGGFITKKKRGSQLNFSVNDSKKLFRFIYVNTDNRFFLKRKYSKFQQAFKIMRAWRSQESSSPCHGENRGFKSHRPRIIVNMKKIIIQEPNLSSLLTTLTGKISEESEARTVLGIKTEIKKMAQQDQLCTHTNQNFAFGDGEEFKQNASNVVGKDNVLTTAEYIAGLEQCGAYTSTQASQSYNTLRIERPELGLPSNYRDFEKNNVRIQHKFEKICKIFKLKPTFYVFFNFKR